MALLRFAAAAASAATATAVFTLHKVDPTTKNGVCLDGTPGAFYFMPGTGVNATKWMVHFEGAWRRRSEALRRCERATAYHFSLSRCVAHRRRLVL